MGKEGESLYLIKIYDWAIVMGKDQDPFTPPEARDLCIKGKVRNHPKFPNGGEIHTSPVDPNSVNGIYFKTLSGSEYCFEGPPSTDYIAFCVRNNIELPNPISPIQVKKIGVTQE